MTWSKTLRDWALGEATEVGAAGAIAEDLRQILAELREQARWLDIHAEQAPNASSEHELRELAHGRATAADRLAVVLGQDASERPSDDAATAEPSADSHWARLVQDLERLRRVRARLLEVGARLDDSPSALATAIEEVFRIADSHLGRLRALIARADPQALN